MIDIKNYQEEVSFDDPRIIREMKVMMEKIAQDKVDAAKFDRHIPATIVSVGVGVADIKLYGTGTTIPNRPYKSYLTLAPGDEVYVLAINNSLNNTIIDSIKYI